MSLDLPKPTGQGDSTSMKVKPSFSHAPGASPSPAGGRAATSSGRRRPRRARRRGSGRLKAARSCRGRRRGAGTDRRGGAGLAAGHAVVEVVDADDVEVDVAAGGVDEVVAADGEQVAVAADTRSPSAPGSPASARWRTGWRGRGWCGTSRGSGSRRRGRCSRCRRRRRAGSMGMLATRPGRGRSRPWWSRCRSRGTRCAAGGRRAGGCPGDERLTTISRLTARLHDRLAGSSPGRASSPPAWVTQDDGPARVALHLAGHLAEVHLGNDEAPGGVGQLLDRSAGKRPEGDQAEQAGPDALLAGGQHGLLRGAGGHAVGDHHDVRRRRCASSRIRRSAGALAWILRLSRRTSRSWTWASFAG